MATRELWYAQEGPIIYDDEELATSWYPAPYDLLPFRAALLSQAYVTDVPVNDIEVARRMDIDGTPGKFLKAGASGLPADAPLEDLATYLQTLLAIWCDEVRLVPKVSSDGPEGTMFYDSDDNSVYVGVE